MGKRVHILCLEIFSLFTVNVATAVIFPLLNGLPGSSCLDDVHHGTCLFLLACFYSRGPVHTINYYYYLTQSVRRFDVGIWLEVNKKYVNFQVFMYKNTYKALIILYIYMYEWIWMRTFYTSTIVINLAVYIFTIVHIINHKIHISALQSLFHCIRVVCSNMLRI